MASVDLVPLWAAILALAVMMYVLLDGFDLGVGMLFALRRDRTDRDTMVASVAPVWDFNETWLMLGGGGLMAMFPLAFSVLIPAVYFPILLMLLGLLFRGVAFEFREASARPRVWDAAFWSGSLLATFAQGAVLGTYVGGVPIEGRAFAGGSWDWLGAFPVATGLGLVVGYALRQRQEIAEHEIYIETLEQDLASAGHQVRALKNDVAWLEDNVDIARAEAYAHTVTIAMLMKEIENADHTAA